MSNMQNVIFNTDTTDNFFRGLTGKNYIVRHGGNLFVKDTACGDHKMTVFSEHTMDCLGTFPVDDCIESYEEFDSFCRSFQEERML